MQCGLKLSQVVMRRNVEKERNKAGWKSWDMAKAAAWNRKCWPENVTAYLPTGKTRIDDDDVVSR